MNAGLTDEVKPVEPHWKLGLPNAYRAPLTSFLSLLPVPLGFSNSRGCRRYDFDLPFLAQQAEVVFPFTKKSSQLFACWV